MSRFKEVAKAIAGALVGAATYVLTQGVVFNDPKWWAALVVFLGVGYGVVWVTPNKNA